jgi:hypothetical protein
MASFKFFLSRRQTDSTTWMFGSCLFMFKRPRRLFRHNVFSDESRAGQAEKLSRRSRRFHKPLWRFTGPSVAHDQGAQGVNGIPYCHSAVF